MLMSSTLSLVGLGFEQGQSKTGLSRSPDVLRSFIPYLREKGLAFVDHGDFVDPLGYRPLKVHGEEDLTARHLAAYEEAFHYLSKSFYLPTQHLQWGGDHSAAIPSVGAFLAHHPSGKVIWIDAHADMNIPEASTTGHFHGMPLAVLMNIGGLASRRFPWLKNILDPRSLLLIGVRDLDPFEGAIARELGLTMISCAEVRAMSSDRLAKLVREFAGAHPLHVSFDIDSVDPLWAAATGVPVNAGLNLTEIEVLGSAIRSSPGFRSLDIVEVNPDLGTSAEVQETMRTALRFLEAAFLPHKEVSDERTARQLSRLDAPAV